MLDFYRKKDEVLKVYPSEFITRYHANLANQVNKSRSGIWREKLTPKEIRQVDFAVGSSAEEAGYHREYRRQGVAVGLRALPGIFLAYTLAVLTRIVDKMPYRLRMNVLNKWPLYVAGFYLRLFRPEKYRKLKEIAKRAEGK